MKPRGPTKSSWSEGYPVNTTYVDQAVPELSPSWLSAVSAFHGQPPLVDGRPLTWLDLGSGTGLPACVVAAANPGVDVWGFDFNPSHVERARELASRAGLGNCHFEEATFAELAAGDAIGPSEVDVVVVDGVYSWVSPANQANIVEVIRKRLRPGGLAYVMYETPAGWAALEPWVEALRLHAAADARPGFLAFPAAAAAVTAFLDATAESHPLPPKEATQVGMWATANPFYAAHEYLGDHFGPLMFDQVAAEMSAARCTYIGAIEMTDHLPAYWAPPGPLEMLDNIDDVAVREMLRDLMIQRALRRDLFRRGASHTLPLQRRAWIEDLQFVGLGKVYGEDLIDLPGGQVALDPAYHRPLVDALASGPLDVSAVRTIHPEWTFDDAATSLALQVAGGYAAPARRGGIDPAVQRSSRRLNEVLIAENRLGADHAYLVSPIIGSVVVCDSLEVLAIGALWDGMEPEIEPIASHILDLLVSQNRYVREDGQLIEDPHEARQIIEARVSGALAKHDGPFLHLGIC